MAFEIICGDAKTVLRTLPENFFQCCVTSPPYWGLRDYGIDGQLGLEDTPTEYVDRMVQVFAEVHRVLKEDGTLWLNIGDVYFGGGYSNHKINGPEWATKMNGDKRRSRQQDYIRANPSLKPKDLVGIPWRLAFALRDFGWYLRSEIVWHKPNPMPESICDRPTKSHEQLFLLTKSKKYFYDNVASGEPMKAASKERYNYAFCGTKNEQLAEANKKGVGRRTSIIGNRSSKELRNMRTVWTMTTQRFKGAHFAVMPRGLVKPCLLAGGTPDCTVLDPFSGAGTTGVVACEMGMNYVGIELNPEYAKMSTARIMESISSGNIA